MKKVKIAVVASTIALAGFGASLGAHALPMSDAQRGCFGNGGMWEEWTDFVEDDDGVFQGTTYATCTFFPEGNGEPAYVEYYENGEFQMGCVDTPTPRCSGGKAPEPQPTSAPSDPRVGSTSGTYQQPTATTSPRTTGTTSGTYSR